MIVDLRKGKQRSSEFPFRFFDYKKEWKEYAKEYPQVVASAVEDLESRFKGKTADVFSKAVEYIPRSLMSRPYQYWIAHRLMALLNYEVRGHVLDYGCGAGNMGMIFANAGFSTDFIEVKGVITDFLKWRVKKYNLLSDVLTHEDEVAVNKYDLVCMQNVMEHLDEPLEVLKKLTASIKEGGYFFITCNTSGYGLDVVNQETLDKVLYPYLYQHFTVVNNTDNMLFKKK